MAETIEIRAFMGLAATFKERNWSNPFWFKINGDIIGCELLKNLNIPEEQVEVIFVNGKAFVSADALIKLGDRVALVPPGTPGPYRVLMGFVKKE